MTLNQQSMPSSALPKLDLENLLNAVVNITQETGELLTVFYNQHLQSAIDVQRKEDTSPVTAADIAAHDLIEAALLRLVPEIPVLSEESADVSERTEWSRFWLVDPLDGTREFINKTGEFTVNIALVEAGHVVLGVIGVPLKQQVYAAIHDLNPEGPLKQAYRIDADKSRHILHTRHVDGQHLNTAMSRKSKRPQYAEYQEQLLQAGWQLNIVNAGSAYKFCLMADGSIDLYPRLHPTSEWDTAAGQCLLEVLGGSIVDLAGKPFRYNQRDHLLNGSFIAVADMSLLPEVLPKAFVRFEE
ncbi:3'(2'),5'-bisphosphate nucleotidase CysQ [Aquirhabdus sp.]|uniref:3'(2'),5'-bisphosphate nucleotidase CysQ n=1 Tax=Aquirhabdus sp. TaxID=2824160 RepID=UPI00396C7C4C